jgi:hypothetical protein
MRVLLLLACLASAAERRAPAPVQLHPLLLGDPGAAHGPLAGALAAQAELLTKQGPMPGVAAAVLLEPALKSSVPAERAAAIVAAKLMSDRSAAEAFLETHPGLKGGPVAGIAGLAYAQTYRDRPDDPSTELGVLAAAALSDPSVSWLFDGSKPGLELDGFSLKGKTIASPAGKVKARGDGLRHAPHPMMPGAAVVVGDETSLRREEAMASDLAAAGAGPRWLGLGRVKGKGGDPLVGVREAVLDSVTLHSLYHRGLYTPEEQALVLDLIARLARGRLKVTALGPESIVFGHTAGDPRRRAFVVGAADVERLPDSVSEGLVWDMLLKEPVFVGLEHAVDGEAIMPPHQVWEPLRDFLYGRVRQPSVPWGQRLRSLFRRKP